MFIFRMKTLAQFFKKNRILIFRILSSFIFLYCVYNYFHTIRKLSVNFPLGDDYDAILDFLNRWQQSDSKISLLFGQHNEHRIVFVRIISLLYFQLFHTINFIHLILIGNAFVFLSWIVLYFSVEDKRKWILLTPILFLLFSFSNWKAQTWAMASLSNYPALFFGFLSLYLLTKENYANFAFGVVCAVFAVFSQGNGIFVFLSGIPLLWKNKPKLISWIGFGAVACLLYFFVFPYSKPAHSQFAFFTFDKLFFLSRIYYGLALLSGVFNSKLVLILGTIPLLAIVYLYKNYRKFSELHISMISFLLLSFASLAVARGGFGIDQVFSSRYQINALLLYSLIYVCLLPYVRIKKHFWLILTFAILFYYNSSLLNLSQIHAQKQKILIDKACKTECETYFTYPTASRAQSILIESYSKGTFQE
ncbi:membrane protein [Leptospira santarosai serovar Shermani str. LT 821]|uniref:Membrane protein n=2 Tax=Leptospira santarosai TaxID=28183 RepID=K8Y1W8_9LEPT|nr:hypothetical protein [Leptospira santarosai]EKT87489.1 membrane protein [Leptospira santarosai serovar Shermani str. LT 821]EPG84244.1 putative membrane protein [Leptospira santarosai serovar Shermani str. 1342KT]